MSIKKILAIGVLGFCLVVLFKFILSKGARLLEEGKYPRLEQDDANASGGARPFLSIKAPEMALPLLTGQTNQLSSHQGKNVVVMAFWASWDTPSRVSFSAIAETMSSYSNKNVMFYAVNQGESEKAIKNFIEKENIECSIVLDKYGNIADAFQVRQLPHLVVLDTQGVVQAVTTGRSKDITKELNRQIDALLSGESVAKVPKKTATTTRGPSIYVKNGLFGKWRDALCRVLRTFAISSGESLIRRPDESATAGLRSPAPIPSGPDAFTWKKLSEQRYRFHARTYLSVATNEATAEHWNSKLTNCVLQFVQWGTLDGDQIYPVPTNLLAQTEFLLKSGCTNSVLSYMHGALLQDSNQEKKSLTWLVSAYTNLLHHPTGCFVALRASQRLAEMLGDCPHCAEPWITNGLEVLKEVCANSVFQSGEDRLLLENLNIALDKGEWKNNTPEVLAILEQSKNIDPWVALCIRGKYETTLAWKARGSGWARSVTDKGWERFKDHLQKARASLVKAWSMKPQYPEPAAIMIRVCMGGCTEQDNERLWFDRAVAAQLDYKPAYEALLWATLPRWGGSHEAMIRFGEECLATRRFDTIVPREYLVFLKQVNSELDDRNSIYLRPGVYENICRFYDGIFQEPLSNDKRKQNQSEFAVLAWLCGQYDKAAMLLKELDGNVSSNVFATYHTEACEVIGETSLRTGPDKKVLQDTDQLMKEKRFDEVADLLTIVLDGESLDDYSRQYLRQRVETALMSAQLEKGEWVDLCRSEDLTGWRVKAGTWHVLTNGYLQGQSASYAEVRCRAPAGENIEVKGEVLLDISPKADSCVTVLLNYCNVGCLSFITFQMNSVQSCVKLSRNYKGGHQRRAAISGTNSFHIILWNRSLSARLNGQDIFKELSLDSDWFGNGEGLLGLCTQSKSPVLFRHLKVRKLTEKPSFGP